MHERQWGFEEADQSEYEELGLRRRADRSDKNVNFWDDDTLLGQDSEGIATVSLTREGVATAVWLASDWRKRVDPRRLHEHIVSAVNTVTLKAVARQAAPLNEQLSAGPQISAPRSEGVANVDQTPLAVEDMQRLLHSATQEIKEFSNATSSNLNESVAVTSSGGHVNAVTRYGQVLKMDLDAHWVSASRNAEIESEILDTLAQVQSRTTENYGTNRSIGPAMDALMSLTQNPGAFVRRMH